MIFLGKICHAFHKTFQLFLNGRLVVGFTFSFAEILLIGGQFCLSHLQVFVGHQSPQPLLQSNSVQVGSCMSKVPRKWPLPASLRQSNGSCS